jgi:HK97 gp10 family phage protein
MGTVRIEVLGGKELDRALREFPDRLHANVMRGALLAGAQVIEDEVKLRVPWFRGRLSDAIGVAAGRVQYGVLTVGVVVGKKGFHWRFLERGTRFLPKREYIASALDATARTAVGVIADEVRKGLAKLIKRAGG